MSDETEFVVPGHGYTPQVPAAGRQVPPHGGSSGQSAAPVAADPRVEYARTHPNIAALPQGGQAHPMRDDPPTASSAAAIAAATGEPASTDGKIAFVGTYQAHDETVSEIVLREPAGDMIGRLGVPVRVVLNGDGEEVEVKFVPLIVNKYITECSFPPLPMSTVRKLKPWDWQQCAQVIAGFFQPPATKRAT